MNFCKNCGATLDPGVKFCKSCGAPAQPPANSRPSFCRGCGAPLNPNARFCKVCGLPAPAIMKEPEPAAPAAPAPAAPEPAKAAPVKAAAPALHCAVCGAELLEKHKFCPNCGRPVSNAPVRLCPSCGKPVREDHAFCPFCGVSVPAAEKPAADIPEPPDIQGMLRMPEFPPVHKYEEPKPPAAREDERKAVLPTKPEPPAVMGKFCMEEPVPPHDEENLSSVKPAVPAPESIDIDAGNTIDLSFGPAPAEPVIEAPAAPKPAVPVPAAAPEIKKAAEQAPVMNIPSMPVPPAAPATGVCLGCGAPLKPGKNFCSKCGRPVSAPAPEDAPTVAPFGLAHAAAPVTPVKEQAPVLNTPTAPVPPTPAMPAKEQAPVLNTPAAPAPGGICLGCGAPLKPGRNFCSKCGRPVNAPAPEDAPTVAPFAVNAPSAPVAPVKEQAPVLNIPSKPVPEAPASPAPSGICLGCGAPLKPGRNFCSKCGRSVNAPAPQDAPTVAPFAVNAPAAPVTPVKEQAPVLNTPTAPIPEQKPVNAPAAPVQETAGRAHEPLSGFTVCTGCGAVVTPGKRFCARCGKPVSAPVTETVASPVRPADSTSSVIVGEKPKFEPVKPAPVLIPDEGPDLDLPESVTAAPEISAPKIEIPDIPEVKIDTPAVPEVKIEAPVIPEVKVEAPVIPEPKIEIPDIPEVKVEAPVIPEPRIEIPDIPEVKIETPRIPEPVIPAPVINAAPVVSAPAVQEEEDLDVCAYCGNAVKAGTKICTRCGKEMLPLPPSPLKKAAPAGPICAGCGTVLSPGNKFCIKCGRPVSAQAANPIPVPNAGPVCSGCGAVLQPGKRFCHKCGKPVGR